MVFALVEPVHASAPPTGLLASATKPTDNSRWEQGFSWRPEICVTYDGFSSCVAHTKNPASPDTDVVYYVPPGFVVEDECTTLDGLRDSDRVRRQVEAITSRVIATELWAGAISTAYPGTVNNAPYVNPFLADGAATAVSGTFTSHETALAALEGAALDASNGQQVFLHVPTEWVFPLGDKIRRVGNVLYTPLDSVIVADAGYPAGEVAYATGPVAVRVSPIELIDSPSQTVSRLTNRQNVLGERVFAATYDPCVHFSVTVTAP